MQHQAEVRAPHSAGGDQDVEVRTRLSLHVEPGGPHVLQADGHSATFRSSSQLRDRLLQMCQGLWAEKTEHVAVRTQEG